ncbi:hypothetical protein, partial [Erythrobacter sp. HI0019]|uniref:hypothetical protein n=1 Tax=Erythrobacter sp. HI0019 TaxID=1822222 RepID=UPI001F29F5F4
MNNLPLFLCSELEEVFQPIPFMWLRSHCKIIGLRPMTGSITRWGKGPDQAILDFSEVVLELLIADGWIVGVWGKASVAECEIVQHGGVGFDPAYLIPMPHRESNLA